MKKLISLLVVALLVLSLTPVLAHAHETIADIVVDSATDEDPDAREFTILLAALEEAELAEVLGGEGPFTVFAPTDEAFGDLLTALDVTAEQLLAHPQLAEVLLYHVVAGEAKSTDINDGDMIKTMQGEYVEVSTDGGVFINDSEVIDPDIEASNGVIHVIDKVLIPKSFGADSIVEIALGNPDFSILVAALQKADLVSALQADGPFTVFAPTNAAFTALLTALEIEAEDLLAQPDLAKVLLYHVVSGKVFAEDLTDGMQADTLNEGQKLTIDLSDPEAPKVNESGISAANIVASNGVIHVIDEVLIPANFVVQEIDHEEDDVPQTGDTRAYPVIILMLLGVAALGTGKLVAKQKQ